MNPFIALLIGVSVASLLILAVVLYTDSYQRQVQAQL